MSNGAEDRAARLEALNRRGSAANLHGAWDRGNRPPASAQRASVWRWSEILPCMLEAGEVAPLDDRMRMRTMGLVDASRPAVGTTTTPTITATVQHLGPGEITEAHRHTRTSVYFMLQGSQVATTAEGEEQWMEPGDLLIQPSWTWHGTINHGDDPAVWLTVQDTGLINLFDAEFRDQYPDGTKQPITKREGYHLQRLGLYQTSAQLDTDGAFFPIKYAWKDAFAALEALAESEETDPHDGAVLDYKNPLTGGPATLTMGCRLQMLQPGEETKPHRHTGSAVYQTVRGSGSARIELDGAEETIEWGEHDLFHIPSWRWHSLRNESATEPLILFSVNDYPLLQLTKLYREESRPR